MKSGMPKIVDIYNHCLSLFLLFFYFFTDKSMKQYFEGAFIVCKPLVKDGHQITNSTKNFLFQSKIEKISKNLFHSIDRTISVLKL